LQASKLFTSKYRSKGIQIIFSVVDLDKSEKFPNNFVCLLPKNIDPKLKQKHKFVELFGQESPKLAHSLLTKALSNEKDLEIREAIRKRLKKLKIEAVPQVICRLCGQLFKDSRVKYGPSRMCPDCRQRIYFIEKKN
jgi:predicted Zn-ribbon and HTH transcriptional regulator